MEVTLTEALYILALGMIIVFIVLYVLMATIALIRNLTGKFNSKQDDSNRKTTVSTAPKQLLPAPGSCGSIQLFDVPDRTAAMVMAIVADNLKVPLNELRFISIKEIDEE